MSNAVLHYLYDPYCGWCFGASPLLSAAQEIEGLHVEPHGVGMLAGARRKLMSQEWREFVRPHEKRITALSHVEFGAPYTDGIQQDSSVVLDSGIPIAAMLAAEKLSGRGLELLKRLQTAYYVEGRPVAERDVILEIATESGFAGPEFMATFDGILGAPLDEHIEASTALLAKLGARGFPAFALQIADRIEALPVGRYFGRPEHFAGDIRAMISAAKGDAA